MAKQAACGHSPARPDVDLAICWRCGVEMIPDPDTNVWRPLTAAESLVERETIRRCRELFLATTPDEYSRILFETIQDGGPAFFVRESLMGRWIIVNAQDHHLAWSGSRWVPHLHGLPVPMMREDGVVYEVQVSNFLSREEAQAYGDKIFSRTK